MLIWLIMALLASEILVNIGLVNGLSSFRHQINKQGPFYLQRLTLILAQTSNHMPNKVWD